MTTSRAEKVAIVVFLTVAIAVAGISTPYWWRGPHGKSSSSTTTITESTFTRHGTFNASSADIQVLSVRADFGRTLPWTYTYPNGTVLYVNPSQWSWTFSVALTWKNISPEPIYFFNGCGNENTDGSILLSSTLVAKELPYSRGCTVAVDYVVLQPGESFTSFFNGHEGGVTGTLLVAKGYGTIQMNLALLWSGSSNPTSGSRQTMNFTASFTI